MQPPVVGTLRTLSVMGMMIQITSCSFCDAPSQKLGFSTDDDAKYHLRGDLAARFERFFFAGFIG